MKAKIDRTTFYAYVRKAPFGGKLLQSQVEAMNEVLKQWDALSQDDIRFLAYPLATVFHETGGKMQPTTEDGYYKTAAQIRKTWPTRFKTLAAAQPYVRNPQKLFNFVYADRMGNGSVASGDGYRFRGRGPIGQTGRGMYRKFGDENNPEQANELVHGVRNMFKGMIEGIYTGKKLSDYFNAKTDDPIAARAIINSKDKATLIAGYYKNFLDAINAAIEAAKRGALPVDVEPEAAKPDDMKPAQSKSLWTIIAGLFTAAGVSISDLMSKGGELLGAINNPWSAVAFVAVLASLGALTWLLATGRLQIMHKGAA